MVSLRRLFILPIQFYQWCISPLLGANCRFYPSCSHYCCEAVERHGIVRGGYLGVKRCLKCHPWHPGGLDEVPGEKVCNDPLLSTSRDNIGE